MGIDGIGGPRPPGGPPAGVGGVDGGEGARPLGRADGAEGAEASHSLEGASASEATARPDALGDVDRARLETGELSVSDYLELQVDRATAHLVDHAPRATVELVRSELREQLAADPVLRSLVERIAAQAR